MTSVEVVGAGFSGLVTAYYLSRLGVPVEIFERSSSVGGLISSHRTARGLVETAANGLLWSPLVEELFNDLGLEMLFPLSASNRRYFFRDRPRRWPLRAGETLGLLRRLSRVWLRGRAGFAPRPGETAEAWGKRVAGGPATELILAPALSGIYAGRPSALSARLLLGGRFDSRKEPSARAQGEPSESRSERARGWGPRAHQEKESEKGRRARILVAPRGGMGELVEELKKRLAHLGVRFRLETTAGPVDPGPWRVICTSARDASCILKDISPEASRALGSVEMLPLLSVTAFYPAQENTLRGFGVLFPRSQGFRALGVLLNSNIFDGRGSSHSETWIFGGAGDASILDLDAAAVAGLLDRERLRLYGRHRAPLELHITRRPEALPHYTIGFETALSQPWDLPERTFLVGNFLGGIGLSQILNRAREVAREIRMGIDGRP